MEISEIIYELKNHISLYETQKLPYHSAFIQYRASELYDNILPLLKEIKINQIEISKNPIIISIIENLVELLLNDAKKHFSTNINDTVVLMSVLNNAKKIYKGILISDALIEKLSNAELDFNWHGH